MDASKVVGWLQTGIPGWIFWPVIGLLFASQILTVITYSLQWRDEYRRRKKARS